MNQLPGTVSKSIALVKNLPGAKQEVPQMLRNLVVGQLAFYGMYTLASGPNRMKLKRWFTVSPDSGLQSLATFHLCHTSAVPLFVNVAALSSLGLFHCRTAGVASFLRIFGLGAAAASAAVAIDARSNPAQTQAGSLGCSAALLSYHAFQNPAYFSMLRVSPFTLPAAALAYGIYNNDAAVVGGLTAGYAAFLLVL